MREVPLGALEKINGWREALIVDLGILAVNLLFRDPASMHAGASIGQRTLESLPSVFVAPEISDDFGIHSRGLDVAAEIGLVSATTIAAKQTSGGWGELTVIALGAQVSSNIADGAIAHGNILNNVEMKQLDVGASAIEFAFGTKFLLDLIDKVRLAENVKLRKLTKIALVAAGVGATVAISYLDSKNFATDLASHSDGLAVGVLAHLRGRRQPGSNYNAAAETFVAAVENG